MYKIKNRWTGEVIYKSDKAKTALEAIEEYVKIARDKNEGAYLGGANLRGAYLGGAYLVGADLGGANLRGAYLGGADLGGAYLVGADLVGAYLRGANLGGADLGGANLRGANLRGADLGGAKGFNPYRTDQLRMLCDQIGKIRAYKIVNSKNEGIYNGGLKYEIGKTISVKDADTDESVQCSKGINLASLDWCLRYYKKGMKIFICEFTQKDIAAIPHGTDGKFRVHKCKVIKEVDYEKIGLQDSGE